MVAISIAVIATLRSGTGIRPTPTRIRSVQASAAATGAGADSAKQSSQNQRSSSPDASAARVTALRCSGAQVGQEHGPDTGSGHRTSTSGVSSAIER